MRRNLSGLQFVSDLAPMITLEFGSFEVAFPSLTAFCPVWVHSAPPTVLFSPLVYACTKRKIIPLSSDYFDFFSFNSSVDLPTPIASALAR
jgi:hypothetical protein